MTSLWVRISDLPTRCCHWLLALIVFRPCWGLCGGRWSRFSSLLYAPSTLIRYLKGGSRPGDQFEVGHNPLGSLSMFALLALLSVQVATGLVADDEISTREPLNRFVSHGLALSATSWHKAYGQWALIALISLHVGANAFYLLRQHHNLIAPMLHGDKSLPADTPASVDWLGSRLLGLTVAVACAAFAFWVGSLGD